MSRPEQPWSDPGHNVIGDLAKYAEPRMLPGNDFGEPALSAVLHGHVCDLPRPTTRRRWWTCPDCGQMWSRHGRRGEQHWRLAHREETQP